MTTPVRIDMSHPDHDAIRHTIATGGNLELHDPNRPDVPPIFLDDFLMSIMRGESPDTPAPTSKP